MSTWVFGYGSLIWRPDFAFEEQQPARLAGYERRFWQGSHDHRGVPDAPGRVVTLVPGDGYCDGVAYLVSKDVIEHTFERLDHREKNGYERAVVDLMLSDERTVSGVVYMAVEDNFAWLGPQDSNVIVSQILASRGPSGRNIDYLLDLAAALRRLDADDVHVFELEQLARQQLE